MPYWPQYELRKPEQTGKKQDWPEIIGKVLDFSTGRGDPCTILFDAPPVIQCRLVDNYATILPPKTWAGSIPKVSIRTMASLAIRSMGTGAGADRCCPPACAPAPVSCVGSCPGPRLRPSQPQGCRAGGRAPPGSGRVFHEIPVKLNGGAFLQLSNFCRDSYL